jgi:DNA-binding response OmpR family regulator
MYVLVIDDEPRVSEALVDLLTLSGHMVRSAADGSEALALLRNERFDAVVLDYALPEMTGGEVFEKLRAMGLDLPVGFITGSRDHPEVERLREQAVPVLFKPFALDEFTLFIEQLDARLKTRLA